jgi:PTH1 family peptidyl-tRNA hydrolase
MNLSGESLREIMNFYKIDKKDFIVVFDDMSMDF